MKNTKLKSVLQMILILSLVAGMLCMSGCTKQPPEPTVTTPTTTAPVETTTPVEETQPTTPVKPTEPTPTAPVIDETYPIDCIHILGDWVVDKASTCTTEGLRYKECALCHGKVEVELIPVTAHSVSDWVVDEPATCTSQGYQHLECTQCTELIISITMGMADHKVTTIPGYEPTEVTPGRTDRVICITCGSIVQESYVIPMLNSIPFIYQLNGDGQSCTITGVLNFTNKELIIPSAIYGYTVTAIGDHAFANRSTIATVLIPQSVNKIGKGAFNGCTDLTDIIYQDTSTQWNLMAKNAEWDLGVSGYTVYCTNTSFFK